jgi:1,4-dihydroxy-2-naphthoyl-CoA synthase
MADGGTVRVERDGPVTVVTIDRPERRNAVDAPTAAALAAAFRDFDRDERASVAVLTGAGGAFCPAPTSRRSRRGSRRGWPPTAMARWARPGCGCPSR